MAIKDNEGRPCSVPFIILKKLLWSDDLQEVYKYIISFLPLVVEVTGIDQRQWHHIGRWIVNVSSHTNQFILNMPWLALWMGSQSHHTARVRSVLTHLRKQKWKTGVSVGDSENELGWNKQSSDYSFPLINQHIWEFQFLQWKASLLSQWATFQFKWIYF